MICARTDTSRADTGSSSTMSRVSVASARAMATRWRCPPLNSWGNSGPCRARGRPGPAPRAPARGSPARERSVWISSGSAMMSCHAHARAERAERVLEHDLHRAAIGHELRAVEVGDVPALEGDRPRGRRLLQQDQLGGGGLPAPGLADEPERLAGADGEVDAVHRLHPRPPAPEQPAAARGSASSGRGPRERDRPRCAPALIARASSEPAAGDAAVAGRRRPAPRVVQRSMASGQRGWKAQPAAGWRGWAAGPGSNRAAPCCRASAPSRAARGCRGAWDRRRARAPAPARRSCPRTSRRPGRTSWPRSPRLWVTKMRATPVSRWMSLRRSRYWAWMVTSRLVVGSSAMTSRGPPASAMAPTMRWRMPPLIWCGYSRIRHSGEGMRTARSRCRTRSRSDRPAKLLVEEAGSATWRKMVKSGFSDAIGSCRIIADAPPADPPHLALALARSGPRPRRSTLPPTMRAARGRSPRSTGRWWSCRCPTRPRARASRPPRA